MTHVKGDDEDSSYFLNVQRAGVGARPVPVESQVKITSELHGPKPRQCKQKEQVVPAGIPPLKEPISFPQGSRML